MIWRTKSRWVSLVGQVAHMWEVRKGRGIFGSREEKRPFAKFNAWRWNTIKMDLMKWGLRLCTWFVVLRSGFSDRFLSTRWSKAESCWTTWATVSFLRTTWATVSFLRTVPLEVTGLHTHTHTHTHTNKHTHIYALTHTSINLSFGEAEVYVSACVHVCVCVCVCVCCRLDRCVFRFPNSIRCSKTETSWLLSFLNKLFVFSPRYEVGPTIRQCCV